MVLARMRRICAFSLAKHPFQMAQQKSEIITRIRIILFMTKKAKSSEHLIQKRMISILMNFQTKLLTLIGSWVRASLAIVAILVLQAACSNTMSPAPANKGQSEGIAMTSAPEKTEVAGIDPTYVTVFRAEAANRNFDLQGYTLKYFETEKTYIVTATHKSQTPLMKGSPPGHKNCKGEIDKATKKLLRFWYSR
jgi:hypothetical protein